MTRIRLCFPYRCISAGWLEDPKVSRLISFCLLLFLIHNLQDLPSCLLFLPSVGRGHCSRRIGCVGYVGPVLRDKRIAPHVLVLLHRTTALCL